MGKGVAASLGSGVALAALPLLWPLELWLWLAASTRTRRHAPPPSQRRNSCVRSRVASFFDTSTQKLGVNSEFDESPAARDSS